MNNKIPYQLFGNPKSQNCLFIHGNGFPPLAYKSFLDNLSKGSCIYAMSQRPFWQTNIKPESINSWGLFKDDVIKFIEQEKLQNTVAIGHSMGGVLILLIEIAQPGTFKKIFLLDPVITSIFKSVLYKILFKINLIDKMHPMIEATNRKRMVFENKNSMYQLYRKKSIFSKINDEYLMDYIDSIIEENHNSIRIKISKKWENTIYRTGSMHDSQIWRNLKNIECPAYVILPNTPQFGHFNYGRKLKNGNKNFKNLFINNSTHLFPLERPKETANLISANL